MAVQMKQVDFTRRLLAFALLGIPAVSSVAAALPSSSTLLVLGDSLSAEYGLPRGAGWVALLKARLAERKLAVKVVNASISGETTSGGVTRLPALLQAQRPQVVVIELGANDALRGLPMGSTMSNLRSMVVACRASGARVLLVGMQVPPNFGKRYTDEFARGFESVSKEQKVSLMPFLLKGVADRPDARDWFQADGIHPQAKAHPIILDGVWAELAPLLLGRQARA
jgi:acyl-CoA thioesterase-1